jgi:hypothetical protein
MEHLKCNYWLGHGQVLREIAQRALISEHCLETCKRSSKAQLNRLLLLARIIQYQ